MKNEHAPSDSRNLSNADIEKINLLDSASTNAMAAAIIGLMEQLVRPPLFDLGQLAATPGALDLLDRTGTNASTLLAQHQRGNWGSVCECDATGNNRAVKAGEKILSSYDLGEQRERIWIITEHDRSVTTLLLPEEY